MLVVAVDVGSTSARAGIFDAQGHRLSRAEHPFGTQRPLDDHAEHRSDEIWQAVIAAVRGVLSTNGIRPEQVVGLAFDATCSLAMFDASGRPVTVSTTGRDEWNVVMWADHRALAKAEEITVTRHRVLDYVGGTMSPEMELPKLLWLKRHLPEAWARYRIALDLADFLSWRGVRQACRVCMHSHMQVDLSQSRGAGLAEGSLRPDRLSRSAQEGQLAPESPANRQFDRPAHP